MGVLGGDQGGGGVAYAAHIGGFVAGLALVKLFDIGTQKDTVLNSNKDHNFLLSSFQRRVIALPLRLQFLKQYDQCKRPQISVR